MPLLVEVQHQSVQRLQGVGYRTVVVLILSALRCPPGQTVLQCLFTILNTFAHLSQPRLTTHLFPILLVGGDGRGTMTSADTSKYIFSFHFF